MSSIADLIPTIDANPNYSRLDYVPRDDLNIMCDHEGVHTQDRGEHKYYRRKCVHRDEEGKPCSMCYDYICVTCICSECGKMKRGWFTRDNIMEFKEL